MTTTSLADRDTRSSRTPRTPRRKRGWRLPAGLLALTVVPVAAGMVRLTELATGAEITPANERFFHSPVPIVLHIVGVSVYAVLGAFQFVPGLRRRRPRWHRIAGRVLVPAGLVAAFAGLWMTVFYDLPEHDGVAVFVMRLLVGTAWAAFLVLGLAAIRRRDIPAHQAWMIRGYAIAMGAGTQVLTNIPWVIVAGEPATGPRAFLMGAGWVINIAVAEWVIRRRPRGGVVAGASGRTPRRHYGRAEVAP